MTWCLGCGEQTRRRRITSINNKDCILEWTLLVTSLRSDAANRTTSPTSSTKRRSLWWMVLVVLCGWRYSLRCRAFPILTTHTHHCYRRCWKAPTIISPLRTSFISPQQTSSSFSPPTCRQRTTTTRHHAKRNKKQGQSRQDLDDLNHWYQAVDAAATPDDIFWEEMERQRLFSEIGGNGGSSTTGSSMLLEDRGSGLLGSSSLPSSSTSSPTVASATSGFIPATSSSSSSSTTTNPGSQRGSHSSAKAAARGSTPRSVEATLTEYAAFMISDNWLDEDLAALMDVMEEEEEVVGLSSDTEEQSRRLEEQLMELENEEVDDDDESDDEDDDDDDDDDTNAWMQSDEPWDHWGEKPEDVEDRYILKFDPSKASEFLYNDEDDEEEAARQEEEFLQRISTVTIRSARLEKARDSPKAKAFFQREPDKLEGYDRMWISAIDNVCFKSLVGSFRDYGIEFADNFGDWENQSIEDLAAYTIEDLASYKAREVFKVTGLPCIASRTSFEIEPIPVTTSRYGRPNAAIITANPRVVSGYRFNDVGMHVDYMLDALRPLSDPARVTRFKTCLCFYDGEMEVFDYGCADVDIHFANSLRTFIPMAAAINEMVKTMQLTFGLQYQNWLKKRLDIAALTSSGYGSASVKLRDRVLKDGKVLPNDIVDVSAFMDSMVDVELMDTCAKELSNIFVDYKPTKLLTVATTGLVIAIPMAKYLQVPLVYARKERNMVMADTFKASYSSKTVGKNRELLVSKSHIDKEDRVLIVDDFLSGGSSQEALLRIVSDAGATAVGVACLLEKVYDSGRRALSGFNVPIQSLCRIASVKDGVIQLVEEDGFDRM